MLITCLKCKRHVDTGQAPAGSTVKCACGLAILVPEGPSTAGKMNCPACGAPVDPSSQKCQFCSTALATVICPGCFGAVFYGAKHCLHCGEALEGRVVIHGDETPRKCPRCREEPLRVEVVSEAAIERCNRCEGLWVDRETVERLVKKHREEGSARLAAAGGQLPTAGAPLKATADGYLRCPVCQQLMWRQNFGKISGVLIDVCRAHGTWFDRDELHRVLEFVRSGGLERSARKTRDLLEAEVKQLQQRVSGLSARGHSLFPESQERFQSGNLAVGLADWVLNIFLK